MIERGDELDSLRQKHSIAENVARHVADTRHRERCSLDVDIHFAEVPLHGLPGPARRDAHFLVIVPGGATARESVAEPEATADGNLVRDIRKCGCAFVGSNDEIWVVAIAADRIGGRHDPAFDEIIGDRKQA